MRKLSSRKRSIKTTLALKRGRHNQLRKARSRRLRKEHLYINSGKPQVNRSLPVGLKTIECPETLSLSADPEQTISFINEIATRREGRVKISIDFSNLKNVEPSASLLLAAVLDCWAHGMGGNIRLYDEKEWNEDVRKLLNEMGLYDLIKIKNAPDQGYRTGIDRKFLRFTTGDNVDGEKYYGPFKEKIEKEFGYLDSMGKLFTACSEAMTNAFQHAYPEAEMLPGFKRKNWWLFGAFDWTTAELTVSFCDLGIGIAKSLPLKYPTEVLNEILSRIPFIGKSNDPQMLKAAMEIGRTKTGKSYRGKGLPGMKQIVKANPSSIFRIYSGNGCYQYSHSGEELCFELNNKVQGTLLEWKFIIPTAQRSLFDVRENAA